MCEVHVDSLMSYIVQYDEPQELVSAPVNDHDVDDAEQIRQALSNHLNTYLI